MTQYRKNMVLSQKLRRNIRNNIAHKSMPMTQYCPNMESFYPESQFKHSLALALVKKQSRGTYMIIFQHQLRGASMRRYS